MQKIGIKIYKNGNTYRQKVGIMLRLDNDVQQIF